VDNVGLEDSVAADLMKKILCFLMLFVTGSLCAADAQPVPDSPLAPLESLVGGVWVAQMPVPKDQAPLQLELRFVWSDNHRTIRFASAFVRGGKRQPYTDGFYAWNGAKQKIAIFYADSGGSLTEGLITADGAGLVNDLVATGPDGKAEPIQVKLTKDGADAFTNAIFLQKDGAWAPFITVRYERKQ
jgi:hypothetical protein